MISRVICRDENEINNKEKQHQHQQMPQLVYTGLHLSLADQTNFSQDITSLINKEKNEIQQCFITQSERLRRALAARHQQHCHALLKASGKRLLEKEMEIERVVRCNSELENRLRRIQAESVAWQGKAVAEQAAASSLHAQLQKAAFELAAAAAGNGEERWCGESPPAEDALSAAFVEPNCGEELERPCRGCFRRPAIVVVLPCCHLCLCVSCDFVAAAGDRCPACGWVRTGSVQVSFC